MTNEKTESSSEIAERLAKILNNQCPVIADGESYGIEPRRAALIIAPIVRAAIEAAIATEARRWCPDSTCSEHQVPRPDCSTCLGAWALKLLSTVERLQAYLAELQEDREDEPATRPISRRQMYDYLTAMISNRDRQIASLQADLAAAERTRIDPQAYRDLEIRIQKLEHANEKLKDEVVAAEQRGREKACVLVQALCRACRGSGIEINWRGEEQVCECCGRLLDAIRTANK